MWDSEWEIVSKNWWLDIFGISNQQLVLQEQTAKVKKQEGWKQAEVPSEFCVEAEDPRRQGKTRPIWLGGTIHHINPKNYHTSCTLHHCASDYNTKYPNVVIILSQDLRLDLVIVLNLDGLAIHHAM